MVKIRFIQELDYILIVCLSGVKFILMEKEKSGVSCLISLPHFWAKLEKI